MPLYVAFLRAINVGKRQVKMEALRGYFTELGFRNVRTFIASGNVIFEAPGKPAAIEKKIEQHLQTALGYEVETFVRTLDELRRLDAAVEKDFRAELAKGTKFYVGFLREAPTNAAALLALGKGPDRFVMGEREFYWISEAGMGVSEVTMPRLNKALGGPSTTRSMVSLRKLMATCE